MWPFRTAEKEKVTSLRAMRAKVVKLFVQEIEQELSLNDNFGCEYYHTKNLMVSTSNYSLYATRADMEYEVTVKYNGTTTSFDISYWQYRKIKRTAEKVRMKKLEENLLSYLIEKN